MWYLPKPSMGKPAIWAFATLQKMAEQAGAEGPLRRAESDVYGQLRTANSYGYPVNPAKTTTRLPAAILTGNPIAPQAFTTGEHWLAGISDTVVWFRTPRGGTHA